MKYKKLIKILVKDGWQEVRTSGSHKIFKHPLKPNQVVVPVHSGEIPKNLVKKILKDAGLNQ